MKSKLRIATTVAAMAIIVSFGTDEAMAQGTTLRWASQGDATTLDPHSQDESLTDGINGQVYDSLLMRDKRFNVVPALATSWKQTSPTVWLLTLRKGVKWHDGSDFMADDVVFSIIRAQQPTSNFKGYANTLGIPRKVDDYTVEFTTPVPNPVFVDLIASASIYIMSKAWCEKHGVTKPQDFKNKEESYALRNAMGTGPYMLVSRDPDVKTVFKKNPNWWGIKEGLFEGNVTDWIYTPIKTPGTRLAALLSGEIDFVLDPPIQDLPRLRREPSIKVFEGSEYRVIFIGMDQARDELHYSDVKGKNPFKDRRVRLAMYQAIDIEAVKSTVMRGMSVPTGVLLPGAKQAGMPDSLNARYPFDLTAAKKLMAEAGYPNGFGLTMDCPNDRYINDERICIALASMWAKIGVNVKVSAIPKANYFPKVQKLDTSLYVLGWGGAGAATDPFFTLNPVLHSRNDKGQGEYNWGNFKVAELDDLIDRSSKETDPAARKELMVKAMQLHHEQVLHLPLHLQVIPWAARKGVDVVHQPNNRLQVFWVTMK